MQVGGMDCVLVCEDCGVGVCGLRVGDRDGGLMCGDGVLAGMDCRLADKVVCWHTRMACMDGGLM